MPRPPSNGRVTSPFGIRIAPVPGASSFHQGEDTIGDGNWAPCTGTVVFAGYYGSWGNVVGIRQRSDSSVIWWVAHHASISIFLGELVREGATFLGPIGRTGNVSGIHVHTERRVGGSARPGTGNATNPRLFYTGGAGGDGDLIEEPPEVIIPERKTNVTTRYALIGSSSDGKGGDGQVIALAGDVGYPCPGNWNEYVRKTGANDRAAQEFEIHGAPIWLDAAGWAQQKARYTTGGVTFDGELTVEPDSALAAAVAENTGVLRELLAATNRLNPPG